MAGGILTLTCKSGFLFNPQPPGSPGLFSNPRYKCEGNKWKSQDDLKSILTKAPDCMGKSNFFRKKGYLGYV